MATLTDAPAQPSVPSLPAALRSSASDFFYNSWRLVPANLLWALGMVAVALAWMASPLLGLLAAVIAVLPTAGMFRLAALIARAEPASFSDATDAMRERVPARLGIGAAIVIGSFVLLTNVIGGVLSGSPLGWGLATLAAWGLLAGGCWAFAFWPILLDPHRPAIGVRQAVSLAAILVLAHPGRMAGLGAVIAILLAVSLAAFVALLTISFAYVALVACHYVLPAADRLEAGLRISRGSAGDARGQ